MKFTEIKLVKLVWAASIITKFLYAYIAYNNYLSNPLLSYKLSNQQFLFVAIGIIAVFSGVLICKSAFKIETKFSKIINQILINIQQGNENFNFQVFTIGLGLIEISALFGLVGFLSSFNILFIIIMFGLSITGWIFSSPISKK